MDVSKHQPLGNEPVVLLDLLVKAAASGQGLVFFDNGIDSAPTRVLYSELLERAQVSGKHYHKGTRIGLITT
jgi:hypothetical protein